jgi:hypothetical protein
MIAKIKTRADFGGIVNYANDQKNKKKSAILLAYEGVCAISNKTIADSFQIQASMRPKVKSSVKHVSLAFSPQDTIRFSDDEKGDTLMVEIAKKWMEQMGISNTQYIIARHHDTEHPHCHIVFNRIDNDGIGLLFESEGDTLSQTLKSDYGNYSDVLRKAFHHELVSLSRRKDREYCEVSNPRVSVALVNVSGNIL